MTDTVKDTVEREAEQTVAEQTRTNRVYIPAVDILESEQEIVLTADMPGVDAENLDITLEKDTLTIYGKVSPETHEGYSLVYAEYGIGDYRRMFRLSNGINREGIEATVKNGVLSLRLPKAEAAKTRKIEVKAA